MPRQDVQSDSMRFAVIEELSDVRGIVLSQARARNHDLRAQFCTQYFCGADKCFAQLRSVAPPEHCRIRLVPDVPDEVLAFGVPRDLAHEVLPERVIVKWKSSVRSIDVVIVVPLVLK